MEPRNAALVLDGQPVSIGSDSALRVEAGKHELNAAAEGFEQQSRRVELFGGEEQTVRFSLTPSSKDSPRPVRRNPWLWTGIGALVVGAAAIGTFYALQSRDPGTTAADGGSTGHVLVGPSNGDAQ